MVIALPQLIIGSMSSSSACFRDVTVGGVRIIQRLHGNSRVLGRQFGDSCHRFYPSFDRGYTGVSADTVKASTLGCSALTSSKIRHISRTSSAGRSESWSVPLSFGSVCSSSFSTATEHRRRGKMVVVPSVKLNDGSEMPVFGLGTYLSKENEGVEALRHAIDIGYRHIDTAFFYQNEKEVGQVIKEKIAAGVVKREDLYIVTKLWNIYHDPAKVEEACKKSLDNLGLDYIDLYLMHFPVGYKFIDDNHLLPKDEAGTLQLSDYDYLDTYKAMEKLVKKGWVKSIGISNFNSEQTDRVLQNCEIKPVTNQVECHPGFNQKKLIEFSKQRDIVITAYSPLARPNPAEKKPAFLFDEKMLAIAEKYKKTPSQIALRYLIDIGTVPIPKSANKKRLEENINIFDFKLTEDEIKVVDSFHTGERINPFNLVKAQNHKYFPFALEF
ncbi:1,5-anhydro-D-fructose reductase-like [Hermetia illucens]|nr:1,5-anhydro-D-fructose reductase-like [Hermetia illucens]